MKTMRNFYYLLFIIFFTSSHFNLSAQKNEKSTKSDPNVPIFEIKNDAGQTVFAVYPGGVKIFVDDQYKAAGGGFTVGRLSTGKASGGEILSVSPGNVNIYLDTASTVKAAGGGFTVGRLSTGKKALGTTENFLTVTPDSTRVYIDDKSTAGFAVGKIGSTIGVQNFMHLRRDNYFIGHKSGERSTGLFNLFLGYESGFSNTTGTSNTFIGHRSGYSNTSGQNNVFIGNGAGYSSSGSDYNTYIGYQAGYNATSNFNTAVGYQAGFSQSTWQAGTFLGYLAGKNTTGRQNVFLGAGAGLGFTTGGDNVCVGANAGGSNNYPFVEATGAKNVFIGYYAGYKSAAAAHNVILGAQDPFGNTKITGSYNVYIGEDAGNQSGAGSNNVFIGYNAGKNETGSNKLYIDNSSTATPLIYGEFDNNGVAINDADLHGKTFWVNGSAGGTENWNATSDKRLKTNISEINGALNKVLQLKGVSFTWKDTKVHGTKKNIGFIAQDIQKILPEVVNKSGKYYTVQYAPVTAVLVEAIKEQQKQIEELKAENQKLAQKVSEIDELRAEITELKSLVKDMVDSKENQKTESAK